MRPRRGVTAARDTGSDKIRVYVCDDSAVARMALRKLLASDASFELVGEAPDGRTALRQIPRLGPDIVLMDAVMAPPDGIEITRRLLNLASFRILMISDLAGRDTRLGFRALEAGALDLVPKPSREDLLDERKAQRWLRRLRRFSDVPLVTRRTSSPGSNREPDSAAATTAVRSDYRSDRPRVIQRVAIGTSTGGPPALHRLLAGLGTPPWPVLVVQHITSGFTTGLAGWLSEVSGLEVRLAADGEAPRPGVVYLAPDDHHLLWRASSTPAGRLRLESGTPRWRHRPSVDALFESLAAAGAATTTCAVLLTGMGKDGAQGLLDLHRLGALTLAQDEASSAVWGMPKAAIDLGAAREIVALDDLADHLRRLPWPNRTG